MNLVHENRSACVDCVGYLANGDIPEDRPNLADEIKTQWWNPDYTLVLSGEELGFAWQACHCCGSRLGGDRYAFSVLG